MDFFQIIFIAGNFRLENEGSFGIFILKRGWNEGAMDKPETASQGQETAASPPEQTPAPEEPIILKELFPSAEKDLDALFPDPGMKKLLKDVVQTKKKNARFLTRINLRKILPESEGEE